MPLRPSPDITDALNRAADRHELPRELLHALAYVESRYDPEAVSGAGAVGLLQLMPGTAEGLDVDPWDPVQNAEGGARFLKDLLNYYDGDLEKALAAYNWGPGNVNSGKPWPSSVRVYVDNVIDRYQQTATPFVISVPIRLPKPLWQVFLSYVVRPVQVLS